MSATVSIILVVALVGVLAACGDPIQPLDEQVFYEGPAFSLKVVRYYRNVPFTPLGERAVVMCRPNTEASTAGPARNDDWRILGETDAAGVESARQAVPLVQDDYQVIDGQVLVAVATAINISFDGCRHFIHWDPAQLPGITPEALDGDATPRYENIEVTRPGEVSFVVSSPAFREAASLRVRTHDNGATWHVDPVGVR